MPALTPEKQPLFNGELYSAFGEQFYRENWQRYYELYPEVDAPAPGE
jgi:hypothetical protein